MKAAGILSLSALIIALSIGTAFVIGNRHCELLTYLGKAIESLGK